MIVDKHKPQLNNPEDYYNLTKNDILLSEVEKEMITNTLENSKRTFAGVTLKFEDPILRKFAIICYVKVNDVFEREIVKANIKKYIALYFINNKDSKFQLRNVEECFNQNKELYSIMYQHIVPVLSTRLSQVSSSELEMDDELMDY